MLHGQNIFRQHIGRMRPDDRDTQNLVFAGHRQHLHKTVGLTVGQGTVKFIQAIARHLIRHALGRGFLFVQADTGHFRVDESGRRNGAVIHLERFEVTKQRIHRRKPRLVRCRVGELVRPSHIACSKNIRVQRLQISVGLDRAVRGHTDVFKAIALQAGLTPHRTHQEIKRNGQLLRFALRHGHQHFFGALALTPQRLMRGQHPHPIGLQGLAHMLRHLCVFSQQEAIGHFNLRDLRPQARKAL